MADGGSMRIEIDVVTRSLRWADESTRQLPTVDEMARAEAEADGIILTNTTPQIRKDYVLRARRVLYHLGSGELPYPCMASTSALKFVGSMPAEILVCSLDEEHSGLHRTSTGTTFIERTDTVQT